MSEGHKEIGDSLTIIKRDLDWLQVIKLALNKQDWGKTYTLYQEGDVTINCSMESSRFLPVLKYVLARVV